MSSIFQGFQEPDGRTRIRVSATPPAGAFVFRGFLFDPVRYAFVLRGYVAEPLVYINGIAVYAATGIIPYNRAVGPFSVVPGGLLVDDLGVLQHLAGLPDFVHQGVGLDKDGRLAVANISS